MYYIIITIVFWVFYSIFKDLKKQKANKVAPVVNIDPEHSQYAIRRRKRLESRARRLDCHRRIWSVLFLTKSFYEIEERMKTDYPTKKMISDLETAKKAVLENKPTANDIEVAIRFIRIEHERGKCSHKLRHADIESIKNIYDIACLPTPTR